MGKGMLEEAVSTGTRYKEQRVECVHYMPRGTAHSSIRREGTRTRQGKQESRSARGGAGGGGETTCSGLVKTQPALISTMNQLLA